MKAYPGLRWIIPHGGGAVPYHWGRFKGMAQDKGWDFEHLMDHIYFDTCVYHQKGIDLLLDVVPIDNVLFASEMIGAVRGIDPDTGYNYDDIKVYIDHSVLDRDAKRKVFSTNALKVFPRLDLKEPLDAG
jgi:4-oxalmesaconate hydratase